MDESRNPQSPLPPGFRQGVVSAITVVIGFSLLFMRYWGFEATGRLTRTSIVAGLVLNVAVLLEFYALWRALQPEDEQDFILLFSSLSLFFSREKNTSPARHPPSLMIHHKSMWMGKREFRPTIFFFNFYWIL